MYFVLILRSQQSNTVNVFLQSVARNSKGTAKTYGNGVRHFERFLNGQLIDNVIQQLQEKQLDVYTLLNEFVSYLDGLSPKLGASTITLHGAAICSLFEFSDIEISQHKFKRRVKQVKKYREYEYPIDVSDIRNLLIKCTNRRLKAYILLLASSGLRAMEACSLRLQDVDFTSAPTKIHVRKEYNKTRQARDVYISNEATEYLKGLIEWKYRNSNRLMQPTDLVFSIYFIDNPNPEKIYSRMQAEFLKLLHVAKLDELKENSVRHKITLHSFRRFVKTVISDNAGSDYSEWFVGRNHSVYWGKKEPERRMIYAQKCIPSLTILDYTAMDTRSRNIETAMKEKDKAIQQLMKQMEIMNKRTEVLESLVKNPKQLMEMSTS
jgi:integrase